MRGQPSLSFGWTVRLALRGFTAEFREGMMIRVGAIRGFRHSPMSDLSETARWRLSKPAGGFTFEYPTPFSLLFPPLAFYLQRY